jgi:serine/threonine-protein kinase HipA
MRNLQVYIEIKGVEKYVGNIIGNTYEDAFFTYAESYFTQPDARAISLSLPLENRTFNAQITRIFFEGLLPEGFTRRCVAEWMKADEQDYLSILSGLGNECLGAIKIIEENAKEMSSEYRLLSEQDVKNLAKEGASESAQLVTKAHLSLTGASGKVGLYYDEKEKQWYLPVGEAPSTHIVKQSHIRLKQIVTNEQFCLLTAKNLGIQIPESFIVNMGDAKDEDVLFATKRYDRKMSIDGKQLNGLPIPFRLHQEDFSQALGIPASLKYEKNQSRYLKRLFEILKHYSSDPMNDQLRLWDICIFNYLIGNTDNHIKNLSLLYGEDLKTIRLAPAYDIVSTMIYENSSEEMALSIDGIYHIYQIKRNSFENEAKYIGLGSKIAMMHFDNMVNKFKTAMKNAKDKMNAQGYDQVDSIYKQILNKGGISLYLK